MSASSTHRKFNALIRKPTAPSLAVCIGCNASNCTDINATGACRSCRHICATCHADYKHDLPRDCNDEFFECLECKEDRADATLRASQLADGFDPAKAVAEYMAAHTTTTSATKNLEAIQALYPTKHDVVYDAFREHMQQK